MKLDFLDGRLFLIILGDWSIIFINYSFNRYDDGCEIVLLVFRIFLRIFMFVSGSYFIIRVGAFGFVR